MKRYLSIFLLLTIVLTVPGCQKHPGDPAGPSAADTTDVTEPDTAEPFYVLDFDPAVMQISSAQMLETDSSFIYRAKTMLLFTDKEYMEWMPLCGKPDCRHRDNKCNAVTEGEFAIIWLYGEYIYYSFENLSSSSAPIAVDLWRMKTDGSAHELVAEISHAPDPKQQRGTCSWSWFFHNKYMFLQCVTSRSSVDELQRDYYYVELDKPQEGAKRYVLTLDGTSETGIGVPLCGEGSLLYYCPETGSNTVIKADISSFTAQTLCELPFDSENIVKQCRRVDDKLYFVSCGKEARIVSMDMQTGDAETVNFDSTKQALWAFPYMGYIFGGPGRTFDENDPKGLIVYDMNGEPVQEVAYENYNANVYPRYAVGYYVFGSESAVDLNDKSRLNFLQNHAPNWYLDVRDVGTDRLMWRKWEP